MEMILTESILPPKYVRGAACKVVGIEPHPREPPIHDRESIASHGCVLLSVPIKTSHLDASTLTAFSIGAQTT